MSVFDASFVVEALVGADDLGAAALGRLRDEHNPAAPQILKAETVSAIRSMAHRGDISESRARAALDQVRRLAVATYAIEPMMDRIWEMRSSVSVYDAWYVALAERLSVTLVTTDRRLAAANGPRCEIEVVG